MAMLNIKSKQQLLDYARKTISYELGILKEKPLLDFPGEKCGAFVTLRKRGNLRGCIGNISSEHPLSETIHEMALAAAFRDPRFTPLTAEELDDISIEISILSPLLKVDNPAKIKPGRDGLYVKNGYSSGLLLPQVAIEQNWNREKFIDQTFIKAGLSPEFKDDENTELYSFTADYFGEKN
jgi:AmmeMemoRadiSam system protein A